MPSAPPAAVLLFAMLVPVWLLNGHMHGSHAPVQQCRLADAAAAAAAATAALLNAPLVFEENASPQSVPDGSPCNYECFIHRLAASFIHSLPHPSAPCAFPVGGRLSAGLWARALPAGYKWTLLTVM